MYPSLTSNRSNFPTAPQKNLRFDSFPNDLVAPGRNFYIEIAFMAYNPAMQFTSTGVMTPAGGVRLPIPRKLNEQQSLIWGEASATAAAGQAIQSFLGGKNMADLVGAGSALSGLAINPFMFMYFQRPQYKQFSFSWTLAPNTPQESQTLLQIINRFKGASLPTAMGPIYQYPQIAIIKLHPNNIFGQLLIKPCAVESITIDHTAAATPAFFNNTGAPTTVSITLNLKEIQLWDAKEYGMGAMSSTSIAALTGAAIGGAAGALGGAVQGAAAGRRAGGRLGAIVGGVVGGVGGLISGGTIGSIGGGIGSSF